MRVLGALVVLALGVLAEGEGDAAPLVETEDGKISGLQEKSTKGNTFYSYYNIPFAKPPVGELRFKAPVKAEGWTGVRDGTVAPPLCPQKGLGGLFTGQMEIVGQEDCLYLNIFTPTVDEKAKLPVMVFIHGGAYTMGGADEYPPHVFLDHEVVLVVVQYRLGLLGFLSTEDKVAPGNQGLKDQLLALRWVQDNIHHFGGDCMEVTLFGESAGAASSHLLMLSPYVLGVFKRVILHSGSALCPWALSTKHLEVAQYTARHFECPVDRGSEELLECLRGVDTTELVSLQEHFNKWFMFPMVLAPRVDGSFLPHEPEKLLKEGRHKKVNLISGVTLHEGAMVASAVYGIEPLRAAMLANPEVSMSAALQLEEGDPLLDTVTQEYLKGLDFGEQNADNMTNLFSDRLFKVCQDLTTLFHARNNVKTKKKVFSYELSYRGGRSLGDTYGGEISKNWVSHGDDLFYFFEGGELLQPLEDEDDLQMRDVVTTLWTNFAKTGDPTPDGSLGFKWDPVEGNKLRYLDLSLQPSMEDDSREKIREYWSSLPMRQNLLLHPEKVKGVQETRTEDADNIQQIKEMLEEEKEQTRDEL